MADKKKACPLGVTKLTLWSSIKLLFRRHTSYTSNCLENECAWWDEDCNQCSVKSINNIAEVSWSEYKE